MTTFDTICMAFVTFVLLSVGAGQVWDWMGNR